MDESENLLSSMVSAAGLHGTHPRKIWTYLIDVRECYVLISSGD